MFCLKKKGSACEKMFCLKKTMFHSVKVADHVVYRHEDRLEFS